MTAPIISRQDFDRIREQPCTCSLTELCPACAGLTRLERIHARIVQDPVASRAVDEHLDKIRTAVDSGDYEQALVLVPMLRREIARRKEANA